MTADLTIKRNDLLPTVSVIARDSIGPVDLEGVTARFQMVNVLDGSTKVNATAQVVTNPAFTADVTTNTLTAMGDGITEGQDVTLKSSGSLPGSLSAQRRYYAVNVTSGTLQLSLTLGGSVVDITSIGSGIHTLLLGKVDYEWMSGDTDTAGSYFGEIETTKDGKPLSYPNDSHLLIEIISDLA